MARSSALKVRPGIPIAMVGVWKTSTGEWDCTAEQIEDAVRAQHDPAFRSPIVKIGHRDPRFTDGERQGDGEPAVGYLENLRASEDGRTLLADWVGIPAWLDAIVEAAYPSRSIEASIGAVGVRDTYAMVCTGLAILGVTPPAIESLGDIADLYGVPTDVGSYVAASRIAASALPPGDGMPERALGQVVASAPSIDELRVAFEKWAEGQPALGRHCYVRDILTSSLIAMVWDDEDEGRMYECSWSEQNGAFTFGEPARVRPTYEPVPEESAQVAASIGAPPAAYDVSVRRLYPEHLGAVLSARGRGVVTAGAHPKESSVPISPALAAELGVPEDADDATVLEAVAKLRAPAAPAPEPLQNQEGGTTDTPVPATADVEQLVAAAVEKRTAPILASLTAATTELAEIKAREASKVKDGILNGAILAGKIAPADLEKWAKRYDEAPGVTTDILASTARGSAVPVEAAGHTGGEVTGSGEPFSQAEYDRIFGSAEKAGL